MYTGPPSRCARDNVRRRARAQIKQPTGDARRPLAAAAPREQRQGKIDQKAARPGPGAPSYVRSKNSTQRARRHWLSLTHTGRARRGAAAAALKDAPPRPRPPISTGSVCDGTFVLWRPWRPAAALRPRPARAGGATGAAGRRRLARRIQLTRGQASRRTHRRTVARAGGAAGSTGSLDSLALSPPAGGARTPLSRCPGGRRSLSLPRSEPSPRAAGKKRSVAPPPADGGTCVCGGGRQVATGAR